MRASGQLPQVWYWPYAVPLSLVRMSAPAELKFVFTTHLFDWSSDA